MAKRTVKSIMLARKVLPGTQVKFRNNKSGLKIRSVKTPPGSSFKFGKKR